jgi:hypothetical protein
LEEVLKWLGENGLMAVAIGIIIVLTVGAVAKALKDAFWLVSWIPRFVGWFSNRPPGGSGGVAPPVPAGPSPGPNPDQLKTLHDLLGHPNLSDEEKGRVKATLFELLNVTPGQDEAGRQADASLREAVDDIVDEDKEETLALALIAEGQRDEGFARLETAASEETQRTAEKWTRIGAIAYDLDKARARDAYARAVALVPETWRCIYLGRLQAQTGDLAAARVTLETALARVADNDRRSRSTLQNELGELLPVLRTPS